MPIINSTEFGSITIDNIKYSQVLILENRVIERDYNKLKELFGTSHKIGDWEFNELIGGKPEVILIGTGEQGMLVVEDKVIHAIRDMGVEFIIEKTPIAINIYNERVRSGKKINALIHTTC